jgi:uncharacterized YccA/Bax inhibitor family protein
VSRNPTMSDASYDRALTSLGTGTATMTVGGTVVKTLWLLAFVLVTFAFGWTRAMEGGTASSSIGAWAVGASVLAFVLSLVISFKPSTVAILAPIFALVQGLVLGVVSAYFETTYPGIASQAALGTLGVFTGMLVLYRTRIIKVTERFRSIVMLAMWAIVFIYLASFVMSLLGATMPYIHEATPIGIGFSVLVIIVAALMLLTDFDFIERGARDGAPAKMEWYGAFALLVSLVWVYIEMLRLLSKLRSR